MIIDISWMEIVLLTAFGKFVTHSLTHEHLQAHTAKLPAKNMYMRLLSS